MCDFESFRNKTNELLIKKGLTGKKIGEQSFANHFKANAWYAHSEHKDGVEMLDILLDDSNLFDGVKFNSNFYTTLDSLCPRLISNKTWQQLYPTLVNFKGERIGTGEFYLAVVVQNWSLCKDMRKGDGSVAGGSREIKANGASLKPHSDTQFRAIDDINKTIFEGHRAGPKKEWITWRNWLDSKGNLGTQLHIILLAFGRLYPGKDIHTMCEKIVECRDPVEFNNIIGKEVLKWYKHNDKWESLIVIDTDTHKIANIANINDLSHLPNVSFDWISNRGGNTRTMGDGYVNIHIKESFELPTILLGTTLNT
jgi:hypothetical protein